MFTVGYFLVLLRSKRIQTFQMKYISLDEGFYTGVELLPNPQIYKQYNNPQIYILHCKIHPCKS